MSNEGRFVRIESDNIIGEIVSEQLHGAYVKYIMGGFEVTEFLTSDDYEILDYFEYEEDE